MGNQIKMIVKSAFSLAALLASSAIAEQGSPSVKSMRDRYEQMIKENKEKADQEMVRKGGKLNKMMADKPSSGLSDAERKQIGEQNRKTQQEGEKSTHDKYKNQIAGGLTDAERKKIAEQKWKSQEEGQKTSHTSSAAPAGPELTGHPEHVRVAGDHMTKLYTDLKRLPTHAEVVKHLQAEMRNPDGSPLTEAQAKKILTDMDIE